MTISEARKILGKLANNLSDNEIEKEIEVATFLKDLFFAKMNESYKKNVVALPNVP